MTMQLQCSIVQIGHKGLGAAPLPRSRTHSYHRSRDTIQASAFTDLAVLAQMVPPPSTAAAAQNSVQNTLQNAPLGLQESPIRLLIAVTLVAVAVGGYLLREKAQKEK